MYFPILCVKCVFDFWWSVGLFLISLRLRISPMQTLQKRIRLPLWLTKQAKTGIPLCKFLLLVLKLFATQNRALMVELLIDQYLNTKHTVVVCVLGSTVLKVTSFHWSPRKYRRSVGPSAGLTNFRRSPWSYPWSYTYREGGRNCHVHLSWVVLNSGA